MTEITYSHGAVNIPNSPDLLTMLWMDQSDGMQKLLFLDEVAVEGYCYLRLFIFVCDLAILTMEKFKKVITDSKMRLGHNPLTKSVIEDLILVFTLEFGNSCWVVNEALVGSIYGRLKASKVRVQVQSRGSLMHVEKLGNHPFCECDTPVCQHGWSFRMVSVVLASNVKRIGASGFNVNDFLNGGFEEEQESFDDAYSKLSASHSENMDKARKLKRWFESSSPPPGLDFSELREAGRHFMERQDKRNGTNLAVDTPRDIPAPPPPPPRSAPKAKIYKKEINTFTNHILGPSDISRVTRNVKRTTSLPQRDILSPPNSPPTEVTQPRYPQSTIGPDDSSSTAARYQRAYMGTGTVFTTRGAGTEADDRDQRTVLTIQNGLVDGFYKDERLQERERSVLQKLKPINGLPRPFTNTRLNFLINIHTAISRALHQKEGSYLQIMLRVLKQKPKTPVDELLYQVLNCTIDVESNMFVSNAFRVPYIEIGMQVSDDSIAKAFDLLYNEFRSVWFQEMKNLLVPDFHRSYRSLTLQHDQRVKTQSKPDGRGVNQHVRKKSTGGGSILGIKF